MAREQIIREDDDELLGFVDSDTSGWLGQTIFGYTFVRAADRATAVRKVRQEGLAVLTGVWQYFDKDDQAWHSCKLKEAYEHKVVVIRTNEMGYEDPDDYKQVTILNPSETNLVKS